MKIQCYVAINTYTFWLFLLGYEHSYIVDIQLDASYNTALPSQILVL